MFGCLRKLHIALCTKSMGAFGSKCLLGSSLNLLVLLISFEDYNSYNN